MAYKYLPLNSFLLLAFFYFNLIPQHHLLARHTPTATTMDELFILLDSEDARWASTMHSNDDAFDEIFGIYLPYTRSVTAT